MRKLQQGFTLIELMIVVAIIGILAAVAIPNYQQYTKKAKFTEVVQATSPFKLAVETCFQDQQQLASCSTANTNGIPTAAGQSGYVLSVAVGALGTITATAISSNGLSGETYILTPTVNGSTATGQNLTWTKASTSTCVTASIC